MKENFIEFILKYITLEVLIGLIVYKLLTSLLDDVAFPLVLRREESLDPQNFIAQFIFTSISFVVIYIISISI